MRQIHAAWAVLFAGGKCVYEVAIERISNDLFARRQEFSEIVLA